MARTIGECREEMTNKLNDIENDLQYLGGPSGRLTAAEACVIRLKANLSRIIGGICVVSLVVGAAVTVLVLVLNAMSADAKAEKAHLAKVETDVAVMKSDLKHLNDSMKNLNTSIQKLDETLEEFRTAVIFNQPQENYPPTKHEEDK